MTLPLHSPLFVVADETHTNCGGCGCPLTSGVCTRCTTGIPANPLGPGPTERASGDTEIDADYHHFTLPPGYGPKVEGQAVLGGLYA